MNDELKPCPNRYCRNDRVVTASRVLDAAGLSQAFGECPMCGTHGPIVTGATQAGVEAKAREAWNDLPRDGDATREAGPGEATRRMMEAVRATVKASGLDPAKHVECGYSLGVRLTLDDIAAALRENGMEAGS